MSKEKIEVGDWIRLTGEMWAHEHPDAPEYVQVQTLNETIPGTYLIWASDGVGDVGDKDGLYSPSHPENVPEYACEKVDPSEVPDEIRFKGHPSTHIPYVESLKALHDPISPDHYTYPGGVQVIDITRHMDFLTGNAVKYLTRAGRKGSRLEDLKKAEVYLRWAIEDEENA